MSNESRKVYDGRQLSGRPSEQERERPRLTREIRAEIAAPENGCAPSSRAGQSLIGYPSGGKAPYLDASATYSLSHSVGPRGAVALGMKSSKEKTTQCHAPKKMGTRSEGGSVDHSEETQKGLAGALHGLRRSVRGTSLENPGGGTREYGHLAGSAQI